METPRKGSTVVKARDAVEGLLKNGNRGVDNECGGDEASRKPATEVV